jgi:hypothetical protein
MFFSMDPYMGKHSPDIQRIMLDFIGDMVTRATDITSTCYLLCPECEARKARCSSNRTELYRIGRNTRALTHIIHRS